jgi:site-specific DNA-methyltransferase (adenine-specific)
MIPVNEIISGDCVDVLKTFDDKCVDLTVTSPPYDNLRNYKGYSFDFENIAQELYRVTKDGGVLVWVVGDATVKGSETGTSFKQALFFKEIGFNLHDTMIYSRYAMPNTAPRYSQDFEYMFVLSKGAVKTFNALEVPCEYAGVGTSPTSRGKDGVLVGKGRRIIKETKKQSNIWHFSAGAGKSTKDKIAHEHPAIFPESLAENHILTWSNEGDIVLDPFCGSGTTLKMAKLNNRLYAGIDISEEYCEISRKRVDNSGNIEMP